MDGLILVTYLTIFLGDLYLNYGIWSKLITLLYLIEILGCDCFLGDFMRYLIL